MFAFSCVMSCHVMGRSAEGAEFYLGHLRCRSTPTPAGFGVELLLCEPVGVYVDGFV